MWCNLYWHNIIICTFYASWSSQYDRPQSPSSPSPARIRPQFDSCPYTTWNSYQTLDQHTCSRHTLLLLLGGSARRLLSADTVPYHTYLDRGSKDVSLSLQRGPGLKRQRYELRACHLICRELPYHRQTNLVRLYMWIFQRVPRESADL